MTFPKLNTSREERRKEFEELLKDLEPCDETILATQTAPKKKKPALP